MNLLKLFKNLQITYFCVAVAGGAALALIGIFCEIPMLLLCALLWIFVSAVVVGVIAYRRYNKIVALMNDRCKAAEFIEQHNLLLNRRPDKKTKNFLLLNLSAGYLNIGNIEFARQVFGCLSPFEDSAGGDQLKAVYLNNLTIWHRLRGDFSNAEISLAEMQKVLSSGRLKGPAKDSLFFRYEEETFELRVDRGEFEGAEPYFTLAVQKSPTLAGRVCSSYYLGLSLLHNQKPEEAKKAFLFTAENGGDFLVAEKAKERLKTL